jgi:anti-sigma factor RsiW
MLDDEIEGVTCRQVLAALGDYVDGELAGELLGNVERHVRVCSRCERFGGMFAAVIQRLREECHVEDEPATFDRLRARLDGEAP